MVNSLYAALVREYLSDVTTYESDPPMLCLNVEFINRIAGCNVWFERSSSSDEDLKAIANTALESFNIARVTDMANETSKLISMAPMHPLSSAASNTLPQANLNRSHQNNLSTTIVLPCGLPPPSNIDNVIRVARVVRPEGCTMRSGVDIDESSVIQRYSRLVFFLVLS